MADRIRPDEGDPATEAPRTVIPRPAAFTVPEVTCPSCGHGINMHTVANNGGCIQIDCACRWTPNDIAFMVSTGRSRLP
jgi:hypothetical protein